MGSEMCIRDSITETDNAWLYSLSHQTNDTGESEWIHFTGSGYLLRTDAWSYPVLRLKRLGLSRTFRRLVVTLTRRYGVSLIHLDAGAECQGKVHCFASSGCLPRVMSFTVL